MRTLSRRVLFAVLLAVAPGCTRYMYQPVQVDPIPEEWVDVDLFLIGDAGRPDTREEPVLKALERMIARVPERSVVVFLGDNLYPEGLPDSTDASRPIGEFALGAQVDVLKRAGVRGIFVPGNHDWQAGGPDGWAAIRRQEHFIRQYGGEVAELLPTDGCPGPVVRDVGQTLRLVLLDTQWWLHEAGPKPVDPTSTCREDSEAEVVEALQAVLRDSTDRVVVVAGHHPLATGGEHGGYFDWPAYLFPLYPFARRMGWFAPQDINGRAYRTMRAALQRAFEDVRPTVYAAGHEHNLQILAGVGGRYSVVSGSGIYAHTTPVRVTAQSAYAREASGFFRMTIRSDGWARMSAVVVNADGEAREDFSFWIEPKSRAQ